MGSWTHRTLVQPSVWLEKQLGKHSSSLNVLIVQWERLQIDLKLHYVFTYLLVLHLSPTQI